MMPAVARPRRLSVGTPDPRQTGEVAVFVVDRRMNGCADQCIYLVIRPGATMINSVPATAMRAPL